MELAIARQILQALAQGIHPVTGEQMPADSPYNAPPVIRALHAIDRALDPAPVVNPTRSEGPPNAGKPWTEADDAYLQRVFAGGLSGQDTMRAAAAHLGRTRFGVEQRLIKLGLIPRPASAFPLRPEEI